MITNSYPSASPNTHPILPTTTKAADNGSTSRLLDQWVNQPSQSVANAPSDRLEQFVTVLFQALEQNQSYIQQLQSQTQEQQAQERQQQNPYVSEPPALVKDLESLVERLSDPSSHNDGQPAVQELQRFYQETPLNAAYPNLPLGTMLQKLQQSLNSDSPDGLPRQGGLLDTRV